MCPLHRLVGSLALLAALVLASPSSAEWRRVETPNFVVVGEVGAGDLRDIAIKFEGFREALSRILTERATATAVPTVVVVFPNDRAFTPFKPLFQGKPVELAGVFMSRRDINYIALVGDGRPDRFPVVFHEYAHLVISNVTRAVPLWLNEGLAEYYSTFELARGGRQAVLGSPVERHLLRLNETKLLPLEELLKVTRQSPMYNEGDRRSVFYAQSWALTHLILLGEPSRTRELASYVASLANDVPAEQAWQQAFGTADLTRELERYVRRNTFRAVEYLFSERLAAAQPTMAVLPPAEGQAILAEFLVQQRRFSEASDRLALAAKLDPNHPSVAVATAVLEIASERVPDAEKRLATLEQPGHWRNAYLAGIAAADAAERKGTRPVPPDVEMARRFFALARAGRPEFPNAVARLTALEYRSEGRLSPAALEAFARARTLVPGRHDYALLHAQILAGQNDFAGARAVLAALLGTMAPPEYREAARSIAESIDRREAAQRAAQQSRPVNRETKPAVSKTPPAAEPGATRLLLRPLQPGEVRVEGVLERIECVRGAGIFFHLKTTDGIVTATAAQFGDVDFITYRADLQGSVECGTLKEPANVYLTWRPGSGKPPAKLAVAIEFLPKTPPA
jgi:tetratricopeptide (TPR) repeat protein